LEHLGCAIVDSAGPLGRQIMKISETHSDGQTILLGHRGRREIEGLCGHSKHIHMRERFGEFSTLLTSCGGQTGPMKICQMLKILSKQRDRFSSASPYRM
jgi:4-hydroxy-3-methylbut-2-enyl diphosphate reductase IspH